MKNLTIAFLAAATMFSVGACKKKGGGDAGAAVAKMEEMAKGMCECKDKACADKVQGDMTKWSEEMAKKGAGDKDAKPDEATMKKMSEASSKYAECMTKAMSAGAEPTGDPTGDTAGSAAEPTGDTAAAGDLPAECGEYKAAIEALAKCEALPQATRDALAQSYEQTSAAWASVPAEGRAALATACKSAADAVKQSTAACNQ